MYGKQSFHQKWTVFFFSLSLSFSAFQFMYSVWYIRELRVLIFNDQYMWLYMVVHVVERNKTETSNNNKKTLQHKVVSNMNSGAQLMGKSSSCCAWILFCLIQFCLLVSMYERFSCFFTVRPNTMTDLSFLSFLGLPWMLIKLFGLFMQRHTAYKYCVKTRQHRFINDSYSPDMA